MADSRFPNAPDRIKALPIDRRGFPVPFFVGWQDGEPVFPAMDPEKLLAAIKREVCWVCGQPLGRHRVFVIGPMCVANRVSSEPPSHQECARFAAENCPFLANPRMGRVPRERYGGEDPAGIMLDRNPGVTALAYTEGRTKYFNDGKGGVLFEVAPILRVEWWASGRAATHAEVAESFNSGLPNLQRLANEEGPAAIAALARREREARALFPEAA